MNTSPVDGVREKAGPDRSRGAAMAWILALVVLGVAAVMVRGQWVQPREEPWRSLALQESRKRLLQEPKNEALKEEIRREDLRLRQAYFRSLERNRAGAWILLASATGLIVLAHRLRGATRPMPAAEAPTGREVMARRSRWTTAITGGACLAGLVVAGGFGGREPRPTDGSTPTTVRTASPEPGAMGNAAAAKDDGAGAWAAFRGDGSGVAGPATHAERVPLTWDVASGKGVLWKAPVPLAGFNSPVVWSNRVFLTGGDKTQRLVFCFDAGTGGLLWSKPVTGAAAVPAEPPDQSGAAASTAATDGQRVYAIFASGELGALDFGGQLVWSRKLDFQDNGYGHASSLRVWRDRLLVQADQGTEEDGKSGLHAFDTRTGQPVWTTQRPVGGSWASPIVVEAGGKSLVMTAGDPHLMAHDAATGAEVWRAKVLGGELAPSPVRAGNLIVATSPGHALVAMKLDGAGDVTASHVAWKLEKDVPDVPTPLVVGELLFTANTEGHVFCREVATGAAVWDHAFELEFQASPTLLGNRIYLLAQPGTVVVFEAGRAFKELARFEMGEELYASPAVAGGRMFLRGKKTLFAVGEADAKPTEVAHAR